MMIYFLLQAEKLKKLQPHVERHEEEFVEREETPKKKVRFAAPHTFYFMDGEEFLEASKADSGEDKDRCMSKNSRRRQRMDLCNQ